MHISWLHKYFNTNRDVGKYIHICLHTPVEVQCTSFKDLHANEQPHKPSPSHHLTMILKTFASTLLALLICTYVFTNNTKGQYVCVACLSILANICPNATQSPKVSSHSIQKRFDYFHTPPTLKSKYMSTCQLHCWHLHTYICIYVYIGMHFIYDKVAAPPTFCSHVCVPLSWCSPL